MSIWINEQTKVIVQGMTGQMGRIHTPLLTRYGTQIVAGVTPRRGGQKVGHVPIYDTVVEAVWKTEAKASLILVPPRNAADAIIEAVDAGLETVVCVSSNMPIKDTMRIKQYLMGKKTRLIGPNTTGIISPEKAQLGIMAIDLFMKGSVGIIARSGTLMEETAQMLTKAGIGQSTAVAIGADAMSGISYVEALKAFHADRQTKCIVLLGEVGGEREEQAALWLKTHQKKPVVAFVAGTTLQEVAGHDQDSGSAQAKIAAFENVGIKVAKTMTALVEQVRQYG